MARWAVAALGLPLLAALLFPVPVRAEEGTWPAIRESVFAGRPMQDGSALLALDAPKRAADAAVVPITIKALQPQSGSHAIKTLWLVIDENPAPVAGVFHLSPQSGEASIATRVRVNAYTPVHVVAETTDGALWVVDRFVKAAGGCSAPAQKDEAQAMARLGQMKLKAQTAVAPGRIATAQLLVNHPNYSGMQIDQLSRNWIPPDYVKNVTVSYDGRELLRVEGDISISENPSITFDFLPQAGAGPMQVAVEDSEGRKFQKSFELGAGGS